MKRARIISWLVVFCLGLLITEAIAKPKAVKPAIDFTELDKLIPAELKEKNTPGTVITVISGDQIVYQKAFGVANVETNAEMQPEMLFRLGSTTKMFTAAALLTLAENNKIKMNEPIGNRVKGLNGKLAQVTPHHLLSNSAGIRDFAAPVISNDDPSLGNMVRGWKDDVFFADQGEIYSYSSPGYWLSGFVVEELYGKPYADAMTDLLFKPIGMERTTLRPFMAITYPFATGHVVQEGKATIIRPMFNNVAMWPAGSIFSNAKDLSRWVIALMNDGKVEGKQTLSTSLINQMVQHHVPVPGETDSYYGYGLTVFKYKGLEFVGHGGFSRGYGSMIQMVPSKKFAVIVLTNKSGETMRRGPAPLFWAFRNGEATIGVTVHFMDEEFDTGDIAVQAPLALPDGIRGMQADRMCAALGGRLLVEALSRLRLGSLERRPQPAGGSYEGWPTPEDWTISADWPAWRAFNFMRGTDDWGQRYGIVAGGEQLSLAAATSYDAAETLETPLIRDGREVAIQCAPGVLRALEAG